MAAAEQEAHDNNSSCQFQDESYLHGFLGAVGDLQKDGALQDVVLEVEGRRFPCHRLVLSAASPYFRAMFTSDMAESRQKTVVLQGLDAGTCGEILSYIYSGNLHVSLDSVQHLYQAADLLQLNYVRDTCSSYMARNVERSTCVDLYKFADVFSVGIVLKRCLKLICRHFVKVASSEEFCSLSVDQLTEIISHDKLDVKEETRMWEAVVRWVQHSREDRLPHLPSILPHIRFNLLTSDDTAAILEHPLVREHPGSFEVVRNLVKEASNLKKRFGMDALEMACLFNEQCSSRGERFHEIHCMNPREGKHIKINCPTHIETPMSAGIAVTCDNDLYILIGSGDEPMSVLEYNQACSEWEHVGMSPVGSFCRDSYRHECFVEVDRCLYYLHVRELSNHHDVYDDNDMLVVKTRRYNRYTDKWQDCSQLETDAKGGEEFFDNAVACGASLYFLRNSEMYRYDPVHDQWDPRTPPMTMFNLRTAVAIGTEIFCTDYEFNKVMVYDTESDSWEAHPGWLKPKNLTMAFGQPPILFVLENQLHACLWLEAESKPIHLSNLQLESLVFVYDRTEGAWKECPESPLPLKPYSAWTHMCRLARMYNAMS